MSNKLVSVIIVTQRKDNYLESCLESTRAQSYPTVEIIVMDNLQENRFYCQALNQGIKQSKGEFVLCLNDDVMLDKRFIEEALKGFAIDGKIGMVSGKILRFDKKTIDSTGLFLSLWYTAKERGYGVRDKGQFEKPGYIFGVNGAVAFYRREMLEDIKTNSGYFNQDFRIFYEDLDIAWRAENIGWKSYYIPTAVSYHLRGGTVREKTGINKKYARRYLNDEFHFYLIRNRYHTIIRNETLYGFLWHLPFLVLYEPFVWGYILLRVLLKKKIVI